MKTGMKLRWRCGNALEGSADGFDGDDVSGPVSGMMPPPMDYFLFIPWDAAVARRMVMHKSKMRPGTIIKRKLVTAGQIGMILPMRSILWVGIPIKPVE